MAGVRHHDRQSIQVNKSPHDRRTQRAPLLKWAVDVYREVLRVRIHLLFLLFQVLTPLRVMRSARKNLEDLVKVNPHRIWGPPTHESFLGKASTDLNESFKYVEVRTHAYRS
jgi:hypothetical protein